MRFNARLCAALAALIFALLFLKFYAQFVYTDKSNFDTGKKTNKQKGGYNCERGYPIHT